MIELEDPQAEGLQGGYTILCYDADGQRYEKIINYGSSDRINGIEK